MGFPQSLCWANTNCITFKVTQLNPLFSLFHKDLKSMTCTFHNHSMFILQAE